MKPALSVCQSHKDSHTDHYLSYMPVMVAPAYQCTYLYAGAVVLGNYCAGICRRTSHSVLYKQSFLGENERCFLRFHGILNLFFISKHFLKIIKSVSEYATAHCKHSFISNHFLKCFYDATAFCNFSLLT